MRVINTNLFPLPGNPHMLHVCTIQDSLREYVAMLCIKGNKAGQIYIEEVVMHTVDFSKDVWAGCKFIEDDNLANELAEFCRVNNLIDMKKIADTLFDSGKAHLIL